MHPAGFAGHLEVGAEDIGLHIRLEQGEQDDLIAAGVPESDGTVTIVLGDILGIAAAHAVAFFDDEPGSEEGIIKGGIKKSALFFGAAFDLDQI